MKVNFKKIVLFSFILLEFASAMAFSRCAFNPESNPETVSMYLRTRISVSFTIARNRDCEGFGICNWDVVMIIGKINACTGTMAVDDYNSSIINFEIDKAKGITPEGYKKYFSSGNFILEDDAPIPAEYVRALGLAGSKTLIAGKYRVVERNGILYVSIPVK